MLKHDIIKPVPGSERVSNVVLVRKSDGSLSHCTDYRGLNAVTIKANYPLPRIHTCLESLGGNRYYSTLVMRSAYWQIKVTESNIEKTCFVTRKGVFAFKVLSYGLVNAPSTFQRLVDLEFAGLTWEVCLAYLDDVVVFGRDFREHLERSELVFDRLRRTNLKLKPTKCQLLQTRVKFLGSVGSEAGIDPDPEKVEAVVSWPRPKNVTEVLTEVRAFVVLASYYRRHIEHFADTARPLHVLTCKEESFYWTESQEDAFQELKRRLTTAPLLALPIDGGGYVLDTDASSSSLGICLQQWQNRVLRVITVVTPVGYCLRQKLVTALQGEKRSVNLPVEDANSVRQSARYVDTLAKFDMEVVYRPVLQHRNCDALSRRPCSRDPEKPSCRRAAPRHLMSHWRRKYAC